MNTFHFLRPEFLFLLLPAWLLVWWLLKQQHDESRWLKIMDPQLLKHLLLEPEQKHAKIAAPWHLGLVLTLLIVAVSGPSWKLKDSPFAEDDTKIALLMSVKKSMLSTDISPNRLSRANIKIEDLLNLRTDTKTALLAYSGTAHLVLPLTDDQEIIKTFAQALDPSIMPLEGDNIQDALLLAKENVKAKGSTIIVMTDAISPSNAKLAVKNGLGDDMNIILCKMASPQLSSDSDFKNAASILNAKVVEYSADESDVKEVSTLIDSHYKNATKDDNSMYEDGGYYLIPVILILLLLWARQGFIAELWRRA
jgi:Ca-activated chloride channel family protein